MALVSGTTIREIFIPITLHLWAVKCLKKSLGSGSLGTLCLDGDLTLLDSPDALLASLTPFLSLDDDEDDDDDVALTITR